MPESSLHRRDTSAAKSTPHADLEFREIVRILRRRQIVIVTTLGLGIVLAALSILFAKKEYSSTATIEMNQEGGAALGLADLSGIAGGLGDQDKMNMDLLTQQTVIMSDNTALRVIEDLKLDATRPSRFQCLGKNRRWSRSAVCLLIGPHFNESACSRSSGPDCASA
jgi:uncharacterized protein involved in exopolysaccharide biosynthesis